MVNFANIRKALPPTIAIVIIIALAASFFRFRKNLPYKVGSELSGNPSILLSLSDIEIVGRADGERVWSFKAKRADVAQGRVQTELTGLHDGKIYRDKKVAAKVTAGKAVFIPGTGDVDVSDGVKVIADQGFSINAEHVYWSGYFKQLTCPGKVTFAVGESKLVGQNLLADMNRQEVSLENGKMYISVPDVEKLTGEDPQAAKGQNP